jgi:hypothetical protein
MRTPDNPLHGPVRSAACLESSRGGWPEAQVFLVGGLTGGFWSWTWDACGAPEDWLQEANYRQDPIALNLVAIILCSIRCAFVHYSIYDTWILLFSLGSVIHVLSYQCF